jgi:hypothetical protein
MLVAICGLSLASCGDFMQAKDIRDGRKPGAAGPEQNQPTGELKANANADTKQDENKAGENAQNGPGSQSPAPSETGAMDNSNNNNDTGSMAAETGTGGIAGGGMQGDSSPSGNNMGSGTTGSAMGNADGGTAGGSTHHPSDKRRHASRKHKIDSSANRCDHKTVESVNNS